MFARTMNKKKEHTAIDVAWEAAVPDFICTQCKVEADTDEEVEKAP